MLAHCFRVVLTVSFCVMTSLAGAVSLDWSTDKEPVAYQPGETMTFKVQLVENGKPVEGKVLQWLRTGDDGTTAKGEATSSAIRPVEITTSLDRPGFVRLEISVFNPDGSPVKDGQGKSLKFEGGAGVEPAKLEGYPEPADFDAFWKTQKARLAQSPLRATVKESRSTNPQFTVFDVKVDCAGGKPVSGYLTVPKGAKAKSLAARVSFRGYGVTGANPEYHPGTIALQINAHGIENGREPAYYESLKNGELNGYALKPEENAKPETSYFCGMMLRVMRALEFIKSRPEWDGRTLVVAGGSQGGLQALTAAALDHEVTMCYAFKPWCCDLDGIKLGRLRGWRPDPAAGLGYFDSANMAKRIRCETFITAGLGDYVCPPSGVSVVFNNVQGPKTIEYIQGATHGYDPPNAKKQTVSRK